MHQFDLTNYVAAHPDSNWASILKNAVVYSNARTSSPSDSLPATASIFTGAYPRSNGIFWQTVWDRALYAGGSNCTGPPGALCDFSEADDLDNTMLDGGGGVNLSVLPMRKTGWGTCEVILPHNFLRVNTVFEVGRGNGLVTAYADQHPSYEFLNGPSGVGLSEGYFPEIASVNGTLEAQEDWDDLHCLSRSHVLKWNEADKLVQGPRFAIGRMGTGRTAPSILLEALRSTEPISRPSLGHSKMLAILMQQVLQMHL
jgi:hypothetical protein